MIHWVDYKEACWTPFWVLSWTWFPGSLALFQLETIKSWSIARMEKPQKIATDHVSFSLTHKSGFEYLLVAPQSRNGGINFKAETFVAAPIPPFSLCLTFVVVWHAIPSISHWGHHFQSPRREPTGDCYSSTLLRLCVRSKRKNNKEGNRSHLGEGVFDWWINHHPIDWQRHSWNEVKNMWSGERIGITNDMFARFQFHQSGSEPDLTISFLIFTDSPSLSHQHSGWG